MAPCRPPKYSQCSHLNEDERLLNDHIYLSVEVEGLEFKIQVAGDSSCHLTRNPKYSVHIIFTDAVKMGLKQR